MSQTTETKRRRGRKSVVTLLDTDKKVVLKQHHFDYSNDFANQLFIFAKTHLDDTNKEFKTAWSLWTEANSDQIQKEISRMKDAGYEGNVEDKMYFSARYYYRKKAIRATTTEDAEAEEEEDKTQRKKYESMEKTTLKQMNDHILSQIYCDQDVSDSIVRSIMPSKSFENYCSKYGISAEDARIKKTYKNMYWRISKKLSASASSSSSSPSPN